MIENIKWLIDQYTHELDEINTAMKENKGSPYLSGVERAYLRMVMDLRALLEEGEE